MKSKIANSSTRHIAKQTCISRSFDLQIADGLVFIIDRTERTLKGMGGTAYRLKIRQT